MPKANEPRALWPILLIVFVALAAGGCSTSTTNSGLSLVDEQGNHPAGWIASHPRFALPDGSICVSCHGSVTFAAESGGISGVSCFLASRNGQGCHAGGPGAVPHPVGGSWVTTPPAAQPHGNAAKAAPGATTGFAYCQICHGANGDFAGGLSEVPCYTCHGASAPHPSSWLPGATYVHTSTAEGNASLCGFCHYGESTGGNHAPTPPPAGSGCFNNTLCHGSVVPAGTHTTGWLDRDTPAAFHGTFVGQITCETAACHPISGHPTCTSCHFDNQGSRANASLNPSFAHDASVFTNHMNGSYSSVGNVCENCHQTS
ncbi:MAG: hypothetical protein ACXWXD_07980, partial [Candidatus Deferrimicrobiaceae bacterium]